MQFSLKESVETNKITINVKSVWSTINNGFSLIFKGYTCKDEGEVKLKEDIKFDRISSDSIIFLKCNSNLVNTSGIISIVEKKTNVYCADSCRFKESFEFYGNKY